MDGGNDTRASLAQPVADYLLDLRSKLSEAAQQSYAAHYNLRARQKKFQEGDQVIVLAPENTGKMGNRWPGTVVKVKSPYSYLVDLGNGNVRYTHANIARVQGCGVIAECDTEFGKVLSPEIVADTVSCRVLESNQRSSVIYTRVSVPSWSRCSTSWPPASRTSQALRRRDPPHRDDSRVRSQADEAIPCAHRVPSRSQPADTRAAGQGTHTPVCQSDGEPHCLRRQEVRLCTHCL